MTQARHTLKTFRAKDAKRQAARRDRLRAARMPTTHQTMAAIEEGLSFALAAAPIQPMRPMVNIQVVIRTAVEILVDRRGCDEQAAKEAVVVRLRVRDHHRDPYGVPSLSPSPRRDMARATLRQASQQDAVTSTM